MPGGGREHHTDLECLCAQCREEEKLQAGRGVEVTVENKKCSVRVITDEEGGYDYFFKIKTKINKKLGITEPIYPKYKGVDNKLYRPTLTYKPQIKYYPL